MRIEHEDLQEASETLHEILSLMEKGPTREFVEMCENMDIDGESAIETITIALEATNGDAAEASGYVFLIAIIAARKALGREAEADAA